MDDNYIIVQIGNTDYYLEASRFYDLSYINNKLVNTSNQSITMVNNFSDNTTYPRISCSPMSQCRLINNYSSSYIPVSNNIQLKNNQFNMNMLGNIRQNNLLIALLFIILGVKLLWKR